MIEVGVQHHLWLRIKCQKIKQDVEPASPEEPAAFAWLTAAPISPLGTEGSGLGFLRARHRPVALQAAAAHSDSSDNVLPAHADPLCFKEESLRKMLERLGVN